MEEYLNRLNNLKTCYSQYSFEQVMAMENTQIQTLCLEERVQVIRDITSDRLVASNLVNERIRILHDRENQKVQSRREYLDKKFV